MFTCPSCQSDRSRVLPIDPCPSCGKLLPRPDQEGPPANPENPRATILGAGVPAIPPIPKKVPAIPLAPLSDSDEFDAGSTVAESSGKRNERLQRLFPSSSSDPSDIAPTAPKANLPPSALLESLQDTPRGDRESGEEQSEATVPSSRSLSPFEGEDDLSDVYTKTVAEASKPKGEAALQLQTSTQPSGPGFERAESPDVFTKTIAERAHGTTPKPQFESGASMAAMPAAYALPDHSHSESQAADAAIDSLLDDQESTNVDGGFQPPPAPAMIPSVPSTDDAGRAAQATPVWRDAHPSAQRWAAKRTAKAPISPRAGIAALGLMLAGAGAYLLFIFLPSKKPITASEAAELASQAGVNEGAWRLTDELLKAANINAGLFILLGILVLLRGAFHRKSPSAAKRNGMSKGGRLLWICFGVLTISFVALVFRAATA